MPNKILETFPYLSSCTLSETLSPQTLHCTDHGNGPHIIYDQAVHIEDNDEESGEHDPDFIEQHHDILNVSCADIIHS